MSNVLMQSYVWHKEKCFYVGTINRECSAPMAHGLMYAETLVWECNPADLSRKDLIWQGEDCRGSINNHLDICKRLYEGGQGGLEDE